MTTKITEVDRTTISNLRIVDCGDAEGLRYQIDAICTDVDDTERVAMVHIASTYTLEMAEMIVDSINRDRVRAPQVYRRFSGFRAH